MTTSILSAIKMIRAMLTKDEKVKWLWIVGFVFVASTFEILTASIVVIFAQVLQQPESINRYLSLVGISQITPSRTIAYCALLIGIVYFVKNAFAAVEAIFQNFSIQSMKFRFQNRLLQRYAQVDYRVHITRNSAHGIQIIGGDVEYMFSSGLLSLAIMFSESVVLTFLLLMIICINPMLAIIISSLLALLALCFVKLVLPHFYSIGQKMQTAELYSRLHLIQFFHSFKEIIILGKRDYFVSMYGKYSLQKSKVFALQNSLNTLPRLIIEVVFVGIFVFAVAILCLRHETTLQIMSIMAGYMYAGFRLMPGLNRIVNQMNVFKASIPSIESVYKEHISIEAMNSYIDARNLQFEKNIILNNVSFQYLNTDKIALHGISFEIKKGERIGIVGETGSGKSTLIDLLLGLLQPCKGNILVDDKYPVNSYEWHARIGYVPQSIYLVDDTIAANIAFGEDQIEQDRLIKAISAAQLDMLISELPHGVNTVVGEQGIRLSGGERQRIAIARALYRDPEVLIFDEATSALDSETEARLMETISLVSKHRTVIMIAHRLTTLRDCDRIIVMENGGIKSVTHYDYIADQSMV